MLFILISKRIYFPHTLWMSPKTCCRRSVRVHISPDAHNNINYFLSPQIDIKWTLIDFNENVYYAQMSILSVRCQMWSAGIAVCYHLPHIEKLCLDEYCLFLLLIFIPNCGCLRWFFVWDIGMSVKFFKF